MSYLTDNINMPSFELSPPSTHEKFFLYFDKEGAEYPKLVDSSITQAMGAEAIKATEGTLLPQSVGIGRYRKVQVADPAGLQAEKAQLAKWQAIDTIYRQAAQQSTTERDYDITIETADTKAILTNEEMVNRMEIDHAVKTAPDWVDQVSDINRDNLITYIGNTRSAYATTTSTVRQQDRKSVSEHQALQETDEYFKALIDRADTLDNDAFYEAIALKESMTFIGEKEYAEATQAIATYWKSLLDKDPGLQIAALTGAISRSYNDTTKSDEYMLENILSHFTTEELEKYKGRLVTTMAGIKETDSQKLRIVLLDDWTISGMQLSIIAGALINHYPQYASSIEIQLIVANEERITRGLPISDGAGLIERSQKLPLPVRAYYKAHYSEGASRSGAHITGYYSSVDYDFELLINDLTKRLEIAGSRRGQKLPDELKAMPPLTNIVRPYHKPGFALTQTNRLNEINSRTIPV